MVKIVVIDSGLDRMYKNEKVLKGVAVKEGPSGLQISEDFFDYVGHGTATIDIIMQTNPNVEIIPVKICDDAVHTSLERLCYALKYVAENIEFDIIQASLGVITYSRELHDCIKCIVNDLHKIVISAFDNTGAISYPAAFDEVIGIDINQMYNNGNHYDIFLDNMIDIAGADVYYRTAYLEGKRTVIRGTSMLTSYFTAIIASLFRDGITKDEILSHLSKDANNVYEYETGFFHPRQFVKSIKRAVVFPFNKEIHSVAAFEDLVPFEIACYYDIKHKFLLGRKICDVLGYSDNEKIIKNIDGLDWNDNFDTVILGHLGEISKVLKRDILSEILENCRRNNKKVYCFDNLFEIIPNYENTFEVFCPYEINYLSYERLEGKMSLPHIPVLQICGTSSRQGKYTVQLNIIKEFRKRSIKVAGLGTEPSGPIVGFDECMPCGYGSYKLLDKQMLVKYCNSLVWELEKKEPDIIVTGSQSGMISNSLYHERYLHLNQYSFLLGTNPDGVILCVNAIDDIEFVKRTINFIESAIVTKVFAIVICDGEVMYSSNIFMKNIESRSKLTKEKCEEVFGISVFEIPKLNVINLVDTIIEYYS